MSELSGMLVAEDRPAADAQVVLFAPGRPPLLQFATTAGDGSFSFSAPDELPRDAGLMAKLRRDRVGLHWEPVGSRRPQVVRMPGPFHEVRLRVEGAEPPPELSAWLDPEEAPGVPPEHMRVVHISGPRVRDAHFARCSVEGDESVIRLAPGRWRVGAEAIYDGPLTAEPPADLVAVSARYDGQALEGDPISGYAFDVRGPAGLVLVLAAAEPLS